jgi:hypothetical protein
MVMKVASVFTNIEALGYMIFFAKKPEDIHVL